MIRIRKNKGGFTLVELMVCIIIFVAMTALLVFKYGNFNQSVLLTNLTYDTALTLRTAQNYGLSVKGGLTDSGGTLVSCNSDSFNCAYGVAFTSKTAGSGHLTNNKFILFVDKQNNGKYNGSDDDITVYTLKGGATISKICVISDDCSQTVDEIYISFKRPDPSAMMCSGGCSPKKQYSYVRIVIKGTDNSTRSLSVRSNGQISVDI